MGNRSLAKFVRSAGVLLVTAVTMTVLASPAAAQRSARIRATATVVQPPMTVAALDSAVVETLARALRADSMNVVRPFRPVHPVTLPWGAQVRAVPTGPDRPAGEIRVEYVGN